MFLVFSELEGWTFGALVEYFEDEERTSGPSQQGHGTEDKRHQLRRKASAQFVEKTRHRVLNQITFEFSRTPLKDVVHSPTFVREMDWIDTVWPDLWRRERSIYPTVQLYCLTSAAGSYTDFHVDFGGTSVWYHPVSGLKTFVLIEPTEEHLQIYEDWLKLKDQANTFFIDLLPKDAHIIKLTLGPHETLFLPSGWIHAVHTPIDSLVFGGNLLHGLDMPMQLAIHKLEERTRVPDPFRFPYFAATHFYAASRYLDRILHCNHPLSHRELDTIPDLLQSLEDFWEAVPSDERNRINTSLPTIAGAAQYCLSTHDCDTVESFVETLRTEWNKARQERTIATTTQHVATPPQQPPREAVASSTLQIQLAIASRQSNPLPCPKRREDLASFVDETDEDWVPNSKSRKKPRSKPPAVQRQQPAAKARVNKSSARDRLMKKMKRR